MDKKLVVLIDAILEGGLAANTAAVVTLTVGARHPDLIGPDLTDGSGRTHGGITTLPIPILAADQTTMRDAIDRASELDDVEVVSFSTLAQGLHSYEEYATALASSPVENITYSGIALFGPKKVITSMTGSLARFRS